MTRPLAPLYKGKAPRERIWELDVLRAVAILLMIFDHIAFDFSQLGFYFVKNSLFGTWIVLNKWGISFSGSPLRMAGHYLFAGLFLFLSGISCALSRSNLRRGFELLLVALTLTLITYGGVLLFGFRASEIVIFFGVLHCIAVAILLVAVLERHDRIWLLVFGCGIILAGILIPWYEKDFVADFNAHFWEILFGYAKYGADYFAFFPCGGLVLVGAWFGKTFYADRRSLFPRLGGKWVAPFSFLSRYTLWIYFLHQVLIFVAVFLAGICTGLTPNF